MGGEYTIDRRAVSSVLGATMMVTIVVVLAAVVGGLTLGMSDSTPATVPQITVTHERVDDPSDTDESIAITLDGGDAVATDHLYVIGSVDLDIGGSPDSGVAGGANDGHASAREKFTESSAGNPPQVGIGDTWESGETIYLDPVGSATGTTVRIFWGTKPVVGVNPGTVKGQESYEIATVSVE